RPPWMLDRKNVPLRVGHDAEYAAGRIAKPCHIALRSVRVDRVAAGPSIRVDITEDHLTSLVQSLENPGLPANEPAFAMSHWHVETLVVIQEGTFRGCRLDVNPTILELPRGVVRERRQRAILVRRNQDAGLQQSLETIANAEDEFFRITEAPQVVAQE